ncbi:hypothetical protein BGZ95_010355 [Linnemannia exigua]|uniref:C3H1-type domain-containing protein n=1 Tax=Linnemannia exigua TaxID=604196 RepID=A0AAD4DDJ7_9FUNG|nr:hypothetical protein BGZ95_010355 [Linnemannia exigua]
MSIVLPSLDVDSSAGNATKKFKRVRPQPGSTPPVLSGSSTSAVPASQAATTTPHIPKNVPSDIAAAAQAVFSAPTSFTPEATVTTTGNSDNSNNTNHGGNKKRFRKSKKKNNGNNQGGPSGSALATTETHTPTPNNQAGPPSNQKQGAKRKNNNNPGKGQKRSKLDPQTIARNLDAQPELVGVSKDDDFSELLIQHVTHTNKMLQRDLQEQSRMMLAEQKRQAELLAAQVAGLAAPEESTAGSSTAPQHKQGQHNNNQKSTHQHRNNNNNGQPQQKRQQTPFVPKKDCVYFLQGTCRKAVCTFKHDIAAQQAAMAAKEADSEVKREASRKARGVCNFEKAGACAKGDTCLYSHDLSEEPCTFYHLRGICERGDVCRFGHTPISPERLQKLKDDLEVKLRERNELQANANALANANSNANANANINVNPNVSFGTNPHNAGPVPFQIGTISHGTQGQVQPDIQGHTPLNVFMKFSSELPYLCLFIISLWLSGTVFEELLHCRLVGELLVGLLFGNLAVGTLLPADKTLLILAGEIGVLGLVFEAGLGTDIRRVLKAGPRAALVAAVGIVVPLATGFGFMYGVSQLEHIQEMDEMGHGAGASSGRRDSSDVAIEAVASGASLASTSIAIAVTMMKQQGIMDTAVGTLITTAAMLDDVVSLILLGIVSSIGGSESGLDAEIRPMTVIQPLLASFGIILVGVIGCAVVSRVKVKKASSVEVNVEISDAQSEVGGRMDDISGRSVSSSVKEGSCPEKGPSRRRFGFRTRLFIFYSKFAPTVKLAGMLTVGLGYSILAEYLGSSRLLGAFVAGVFFSPFEDLCSAYESHITHNIQSALSAIFFATIGFAIPLTKILEPVLFGWGVLYAVIASLSKLATMFVVPTRLPSSPLSEDCVIATQFSARRMVGAAMIARGELGLLMVQQAQLQGVMGQTAMAITTWSIVLATLVGVGAFSIVMKRSPE